MAKHSLISICLLLAVAASLAQGQTKLGFYATSCPKVESIVRSTVETHVKNNPAIAPGLLRMHFHDCFVRGCDASILISGANTEKTAGPNLNLRGYEVIDEAKSKLETACPGVVSCADILALAARDSVVVTGGLTWPVPTGRKDGRVSLASETNTLPGFRESVDSQKQKFSDKGLNTQDLVALVGGHTIGTTACQFFSYRLFNTSSAQSDPSINPAFLPTLQGLCPQNGDGTKRISLDTDSVGKFDSSFFTNLRNGKGILESDQKLWTDASTKPFVTAFSVNALFKIQFGKSMIKMSNIGVKTGADGEIRKICSAIN